MNSDKKYEKMRESDRMMREAHEGPTRTMMREKVKTMKRDKRTSRKMER